MSKYALLDKAGKTRLTCEAHAVSGARVQFLGRRNGTPIPAGWTIVKREVKPSAKPKAPTFKVGDKVRVKASVARPSYGWGDVRHGEVGAITSIDGTWGLTVDFPHQVRWRAVSRDMELVKKAEPKKAEPKKAEPKKAEPRRPRVGHTVKVVRTREGHRKGETGELIEDAHDSQPYLVRFQDYETRWYYPGEVEELAKPSLAPGHVELKMDSGDTLEFWLAVEDGELSLMGTNTAGGEFFIYTIRPDGAAVRWANIVLPGL